MKAVKFLRQRDEIWASRTTNNGAGGYKVARLALENVWIECPCPAPSERMGDESVGCDKNSACGEESIP